MALPKKYESCAKTYSGYQRVKAPSLYDLMLKVIEWFNDTIEHVEVLEGELDAKEDSSNITGARKLSENGDFTGTWFGESKSSVDQKILNGQNLYQGVIDLINSNPELNIEIIDGGFFASSVIPEEIDAGDFTSPVTEEIDAGLFIYPCQCSN